MTNHEEKDLNTEADDFGEAVVVITDEEGNEAYFREELILRANDERFALLVPTCSDEEVEATGDEADDENAAFFAKIVLDEDGEETYVEPSDEEFQIVCKMYEDLLAKEEEE